jgi:hypothetical protein
MLATRLRVSQLSEGGCHQLQRRAVLLVLLGARRKAGLCQPGGHAAVIVLSALLLGSRRRRQRGGLCAGGVDWTCRQANKLGRLEIARCTDICAASASAVKSRRNKRRRAACHQTRGT